jgi:Zn-dependent M28 family amino/carboxypeptidase
MPGDNIFNGAMDNATGCGIIAGNRARRTPQAAREAAAFHLLFASVTAEEQGLLGSEYLGQASADSGGQD